MTFGIVNVLAALSSGLFQFGPVLSPFCPQYAFRVFAIARTEAAIQTLTNAEKLSLPTNTAVGMQVQVTDGFVVSGFGDARDGFYFYYNATTFLQRLPFVGDGTDTRTYSDGTWHIGDDALGYIDATASGGTNPWDKSYSGLTLTHPAVQELTAPSTAQGGVFVSGGTQDGIYSIRQEYNNKPLSVLLGIGTGFSYAIIWHAFKWKLVDGASSIVYYSLSDVATPDLASNWKNASDDSPASITVTSVTGGQVAAGIKFGSIFYAITTPVNGRNAYHDVLGVAPDFTWDAGGRVWTDGLNEGIGTPAFPWDTTGISITRDDVCSETNWEVTP